MCHVDEGERVRSEPAGGEEGGGIRGRQVHRIEMEGKQVSQAESSNV